VPGTTSHRTPAETPLCTQLPIYMPPPGPPPHLNPMYNNHASAMPPTHPSFDHPNNPYGTWQPQGSTSLPSFQESHPSSSRSSLDPANPLPRSPASALLARSSQLRAEARTSGQHTRSMSTPSLVGSQRPKAAAKRASQLLDGASISSSIESLAEVVAATQERDSDMVTYKIAKLQVEADERVRAKQLEFDFEDRKLKHELDIAKIRLQSLAMEAWMQSGYAGSSPLLPTLPTGAGQDQDASMVWSSTYGAGPRHDVQYAPNAQYAPEAQHQAQHAPNPQYRAQYAPDAQHQAQYTPAAQDAPDAQPSYDALGHGYDASMSTSYSQFS
jgi:hypothetical protein